MPIGALKNMAQTCPRHHMLLGLDVGKKTIGLALGSVEQGIATPLHTVKRTKFMQDMEALKSVVEEYGVQGFVIGYPVNMDGSEGPRAQSIRDFAVEMEKVLRSSSFRREPESVSQSKKIPDQARDDGSWPWIALWDERLSTVSVEELVDKMVDKRKTKTNKKTSGLLDKLAAQIILQGALDYLKDF